jgi:hypothetical protein
VQTVAAASHGGGRDRLVGFDARILRDRIQTEINMVRAGVLTPNEMRLAEGWPAMEGGDELVPKRSAAGPRISATAPATPCPRRTGPGD